MINTPSKKVINFNVLDIFCGAGGLSLGLEKAGFKTLIGVDFNSEALKTFKNNFPMSEIICGDITKNDVKRKIFDLAKNKMINMIVGGPPCQGFSLKGKKLGLDDPRNFLFKEYLEIVKELKPIVFVIENVKNILSSSNGYFKNKILTEIKKLGYVVNYGVLNAANYAVPQNRERSFFIASKEKVISFPDEIKKKVTVRDAISDLSYLNSGEGKILSKYKNGAKSNYQIKLRSTRLQYHISSNHSDVALKKLKLIPPEKGKEYLPKHMIGKQKFLTTWARLIWDEQSPTIDTRFDTPSNGRNSHPFLNRAITPREAARIQSFPDSFEFIGNKCAVCRQIGNAVPPLLAEAVGTKIMSELNRLEEINNSYAIYNANAYTIIEEFKKNNIRVDHIIADPPYNISKANNFSTMKCKRRGLDFGEWDKTFDLFSWIPEYLQILKQNGSIIIFCSYKYISYICKTLEENKMQVKDIIIWRKTNPMPRNVNRRYVQDMEFAIWAVRNGANWTFNKNKNKPYERSLFETPTVSGKERTMHPTQKSEKMLSELIKIHTNSGDVIMDPFMGSGTTGISAIKNNRKFIGIEIDEKFYAISKSRMNLSNKDLFKFSDLKC